MKLSSVNFVLQQFEAEGYRYFAIYDEDGVLQLSQMEAADPASALVRLRSFLKNNDGYFEVYIFNRKIHASTLIERDRKYIAKFAVELNSSGGVSGFSPVSGVSTPVSASPIPGFSHTVLPADDPRNGAPNSWDMMTRMGAMETQMKLMEKDHAHQREMSERDREIDRLKAELERARGMGAVGDQVLGVAKESLPQLVMGALGAILGPKQTQSAPHHPAPMNGVMVQDEIPTAEDTIMETGAQNNDYMKQFNQGAQGANTGSVDRAVNANLSERQRRMIQAVNDLARNDPNFPENIEKLASIARTNPAVYQMAVQYLKTL